MLYGFEMINICNSTLETLYRLKFYRQPCNSNEEIMILSKT